MKKIKFDLDNVYFWGMVATAVVCAVVAFCYATVPGWTAGFWCLAVAMAEFLAKRLHDNYQAVSDEKAEAERQYLTAQEELNLMRVKYETQVAENESMKHELHHLETTLEERVLETSPEPEPETVKTRVPRKRKKRSDK